VITAAVTPTESDDGDANGKHGNCRADCTLVNVR
jgi:hypothetical protein